MQARGRGGSRLRGLDGVHHQDAGGGPGFYSKWAIGTELNLVQRLANRFAAEDKEVVFLDKTVCFCSTMNRIDLPHLVWALESLAEGNLVNRIQVDKETESFAKLALERMLALP